MRSPAAISALYEDDHLVQLELECKGLMWLGLDLKCFSLLKTLFYTSDLKQQSH